MLSSMPATTRDVAVLLILLLSVPLQLWLVRQPGNWSPEQRPSQVFLLVRQAHRLFQKWFSVHSWYDWTRQLTQRATVKDYSHLYSVEDHHNELGECPAVEVWQFRSPEGYFATSPHPRRLRTRLVNWHVGQVVRHSIHGYHGVIIGWDDTCKAPSEWIEVMHGSNLDWREKPNYAVLVDTEDRPVPQITYVAQENIAPVTQRQIKHPELDNYFDGYDGAQYIPQPWLAAIYPED